MGEAIRSAIAERPRLRFHAAPDANIRCVSVALDYHGETEDEISLLRRAEELISIPQAWERKRLKKHCNVGSQRLGCYASSGPALEEKQRT